MQTAKVRITSAGVTLVLTYVVEMLNIPNQLSII